MSTSFSRTTILYAASIILFFILNGSQVREPVKININKGKKKWVIIAAFTALVLLIAFDYIARKTSKSLGPIGESWWIYYFGSQFYIFDRVVVGFNLRTYGAQSLGIIGRVLLRIGIIPSENTAKLGRLFSENGKAVASFISNPYEDFGILGSIMVLCCFGFLIGYAYRRYNKHGGIWMIIYATCVSQCLLAFYAYTFGSSEQLYGILLVFAMCHLGRSRFREYEICKVKV